MLGFLEIRMSLDSGHTAGVLGLCLADLQTGQHFRAPCGFEYGLQEKLLCLGPLSRENILDTEEDNCAYPSLSLGFAGRLWGTVLRAQVREPLALLWWTSRV